MAARDDISHFGYASERAQQDALDRGFRLSYRDWRSIFLAITDTLAKDGILAPDYVTAHRRGWTLNAERWSVCWRGSMLDLIYDPGRACIMRVENWLGPPGAVRSAPVRPLKDGASARQPVPVH